ncbi:patatin-like phospholipase family protein [Dyadobacter flavalbus]|uniref:Patatin-like phospholipase family protein n=1 Tax=Dyadobacter flavalbus TaxID=2579942 RepID=A0A5M8QYS6_9BACT|nr:patatin-like phospholipase family protein [Dyadobacter flavalbus]KAA6441455.1 patatin-like phospholipase family protein [Dyadobacter flavalbus]
MFIENPIPKQKTNTWFVFSGGGARGCWQWDLYHLIKHLFHIVGFTGTSTGSLTAMAAALDIPYAYLDKLFEQVFANNAKQIFKPGDGHIKNGKFKINKLKLIPKLIFNRKGLKGMMSIDPLVETIEQILTDFPEWKYKFGFNVVDLHTGARIRLTPDDFDDRHQLARGIAASCNIPGLCGPITDLRTKDRVLKCVFDGGIRDGFPLKQAFDSMVLGEANQAVGLGCNPKEMTPLEDLLDIFDYVGAAAYAGMNEMMLGDISEVELVNNFIKEVGEQATGKKYTPITMIYYKGGRGVLEFTPESRLDMKKTAKEDYERLVMAISKAA